MTAEQALQHPFIFDDTPLSNRTLSRTMEKLKEFNSTRKFKVISQVNIDTSLMC